MKKLFIIAIAGLMFFCGSLTNSIAGHYHHGCGHMGDMSAMDSNQDGLITFDEFSAPHMKKYKRVFELLDKDGDEVINEDEMNEFMEVHGYDKNIEG